MVPSIIKTEKDWFTYVGRANYHRTLISAVRLLTDTETLGCWVSPLAQSAPH